MPQILIVDDESSVRDLLRELLEREGYGVTEARDGLEGIQCYQRQPTDLVIVDLQMPHMDGLETIQALQQESSEVKIIAISGGAPAGLGLAMQLGVLHTFQKPFELRTFLRAVGAVLEVPVS